MADIKLRFDNSELTSGLAESENQMKDFANSAEKAGDRVEKSMSNSNKEFDKMNRSAVEAIKHEKQISKEAEEINKSIKKTANSYDVANKKLDQMKKDYRDMVHLGKQNTKEANNLADAIKKSQSELDEVNKKYNEAFKAPDNKRGGLLGAIDNVKGGVNGILDSVGAGGFGAALGWGAAIAGAVKLGQEVLKVDTYFDELRGNISKLTGETGVSLDEATAKIEALANTFGEDQQELTLAANTLSKEFGISVTEALELMEKGFLSNANAQGDLIDNVKEYSSQIKAAGGSAGEFFNILNDAGEQGIFSDKGIDAVKEFGLRIREQTTATQDAMNAAFGEEFTNRIFQGINDGTLSTIDAVKLVSKEMNTFQGDTAKLQTVIADVFGGAGEDAGLDYLKSLQFIKEGTDDLVDSTNELTKRQQHEIEVQEEYAAAQNALSKEISGAESLTGLWTQAKTKLIQALVAVIKWVKQAVSWYSNLSDGMKTTIRTALSLLNPLTAFINLNYELGKALGFWGGQAVIAADATKALNKEQQRKVELLDESLAVTKRLIEASKEELSNAQTLLDALQSENTTREEKEKIMAKLNEDYGDYIGNLIDEEGNISDVEEAYKRLNKAILENTFERLKAEIIQERLNQVFKRQLELAEAEATGGAKDQTVFGAEIDFTEKLRDNLQGALTDFNNLDDIFKIVQDNFDYLSNNLNLNVDFDVADEAVSKAEAKIADIRRKLEDPNLTDKQRQVLESNLQAQIQIVQKYDEARANAIKKALGEEVKAEESAQKERTKVATKGAKDRQKELLKLQDEYEKARKKLFAQQRESELGDIEDQYSKIREKENAELAKIEQAREEFARIKISSEAAEEGIILTDEELENRVNMYELSKEEELAWQTFRQKVHQQANEEIKQLDIEAAKERLKNRLTSVQDEFALINAQETNDISRIEMSGSSREGSQADIERQIQAEILKIRKDSIDKKKALLDQELQLRKDQLNQEIQLLIDAGETEDSIEVQNLERKKELLDAEIEARKIALDKQVQDVKEQAQEILYSFEEIGSAIGSGLNTVFEDMNLQGFDQILGKLGQLTDATLEFSKSLDELSGEERKQAIMDFAASTAQALAEVAAGIVDMIAQANEAQIEENEELLDNIRERRQTVEEELEAEIEAQRQGYANNVAAKQLELQQINQEEQLALQKKEELAKKQEDLETTMQVISLITASAQIFAAFSSIPVVGVPLAIAAIAGMFAAYASFKSQASNTKAEKGMHGDSHGEIKGNRHSQGGEMFLDHLELEDGEKFSIYNRGASKKYAKQIAEFTDLANNGMLPDKDLKDLLNGTGVTMKMEVPQEISNEREQMNISKNIAFNVNNSEDIQALRKDFNEYKEMMKKRKPIVMTKDKRGNNIMIEKDGDSIRKTKLKK